MVAELFSNKYKTLYDTTWKQTQDLDDIWAAMDAAQIKRESSNKISQANVEKA